MQRIDDDFDKFLEKIAQERVKNGHDKKTLGRKEITKMILHTPSFQQLQKELIENENMMKKIINIKSKKFNLK